MTKSKIFLYLSVSFVFGIFLSLMFHSSRLFPLGLSVLSLALVSVFWKRKKIVILGFVLMFLALGAWRGFGAKENSLILEREVSFIGEVSEESDIREDKIQLTVKNKDYGPVLVTVSRYPEYKYGDKLKITGEIKAPFIFEDFNYREYLEKEGIFSVVYYPQVELLKEGGHSFYGKVLSLKEKLRSVLHSNISPPQSFILGAMLLGDKSRMPQELKEKLNRAGVRHVTAVSGMHIVILSGILMSFLLGLGFWRGQAFYISLLILFLFIVMIGAQPSSVRAGIMGGIFLLGQKLGRKGTSTRALLLTASVMLVFNPLLLLYDAGFQLSFLAVMGIIYFGSFFEKIFSFVPKFLNLRNILAMTFSAQALTLPILIYHFGSFSLVASLVNLLVLPVVYWIMILGFIFLLLGLVSPLLGFVFSFPVRLLLEYFYFVADYFSGSWAYQYIGEVDWFWFVAFYLFVFLLAFGLRKKEELRFLNY